MPKSKLLESSCLSKTFKTKDLWNSLKVLHCWFLLGFLSNKNAKKNQPNFQLQQKTIHQRLKPTSKVVEKIPDPMESGTGTFPSPATGETGESELGPLEFQVWTRWRGGWKSWRWRGEFLPFMGEGSIWEIGYLHIIIFTTKLHLDGLNVPAKCLAKYFLSVSWEHILGCAIVVLVKDDFKKVKVGEGLSDGYVNSCFWFP